MTRGGVFTWRSPSAADFCAPAELFRRSAGVNAAPDATGPTAEPVELIPHRKGIGGLVRHADGGFVLAGRNVAHKRPPALSPSATRCAATPFSDHSAQHVALGSPGERPASPTTVLLETADDEQFFNDLTADGRGRLYVGSVGTEPRPGSGAARPDGRLYRLDLDGTITVLADDVLVSNGLGTDPADERLYHVDSNRRLVWAFSLTDDEPAAHPPGSDQIGGDRRRGNRRPGEGREVFVDTAEYAGVPDGLAVAADGSVWVAMAGGGVVVGWDAKGARVAEIPVPQSLVTSVCFGGPDLRTLFVLSGHNHEHPDPAGGCVYRGSANVSGVPGAAARIPL
jgi:gluconolactonase